MFNCTELIKNNFFLNPFFRLYKQHNVVMDFFKLHINIINFHTKLIFNGVEKKLEKTKKADVEFNDSSSKTI